MTPDAARTAERDRLFSELSRALLTREPTAPEVICLRLELACACAETHEEESAVYQLDELSRDALRTFGPGSAQALECGDAFADLLDRLGDSGRAAEARSRARG